MRVELEPREQAAVERASAFAHDVIVPRAAAWERIPATRDIVNLAGEAGLCGLLAPRGLGGCALGLTAMARVMEELAWADFGVAFALVVHNNLVGAICRDGTNSQVERFVPDLVAGRQVGAFLLTEPGAGSDAASLATTASPVGRGWRLDGAKAWITNAADADVLVVFAQTEPALGSRGIASFLVEADQVGVEREDPYWLLGAHAMGTGGFRFDNCLLDQHQLFVPAGHAFKAALSGIDIARVMVSAMCVGLLRSGLDTARSHTRQRSVFGQRVCDLQGVQWQLADVATDLFAARTMAYTAASSLDHGYPCATVEAAHAKKFATRAALSGLAACMQALGARGLRHDLPLARHLAAAKTAQYLDGTTEIQNVVISRALFGGDDRAEHDGTETA